ncbi:nucleotidyltransferase-like protein [Bacillus carboniphilus]|uniref:Nucleotidyltransferase-like protein n=1 Tax=Bacillus carboniphilus TaxID=86663 RepID=A0ABY9JTG5_9BACI|nr:nucleotidyltransferase-like protein [Bacillus carboniphilus]WLR42697.1 nucleotidyltransferase-like protein [Bacillus carboniphilus]
MENLLRPLYQERASNKNTLSIILIEKKDQTSPQTDNMEINLLVIVSDETPSIVKHYLIKDQRAALHIVSEKEINKMILLGTNRRIVDWVLNGKVLFDRNDFHANLLERLRVFPFEERKLKIGIEYAKLIRRYLEGKAFFEKGHHLDAYNHIIHALHHLARLEVIDRGFHPEVTVWNQVKEIEPQIYKLYEELIESDEELEKRLELLFLANDFLIHSKAEIGSSHLLKIMKTKEFWSYEELLHHFEVGLYSIDLSVLIEYLVSRGLLRIESMDAKGNGIFNCVYSIKKMLHSE